MFVNLSKLSLTPDQITGFHKLAVKHAIYAFILYSLLNLVIGIVLMQMMASQIQVIDNGIAYKSILGLVTLFAPLPLAALATAWIAIHKIFLYPAKRYRLEYAQVIKFGRYVLRWSLIAIFVILACMFFMYVLSQVVDVRKLNIQMAFDMTACLLATECVIKAMLTSNDAIINCMYDEKTSK